MHRNRRNDPMLLQIPAALTIGAALLLSSNVHTRAAGELKVSGAAAVATIETESGLILSVTANGDANGLKDL